MSPKMYYAFNVSVNSTVDCPNREIGYGIAMFYLTISLPGIFAYGLTLFTLIHKYRSLNSTFYMLAISLALPDIATLCLTSFYAVPCILYCGHVMSFVTPYFFAWLTHVCWYMQITFIFIISINRFVCMRSRAFKRYDKYFNSRRMLLYIGLSVSFSLIMITALNLASCYSLYDFQNYFFNLKCYEPKFEKSAMLTNLILCDVIIGATVLLYMASWIVMKLESKKFLITGRVSTVISSVENNTTDAVVAAVPGNFQHLARKKAESRLFAQFIVVTSVLVLYELSFFVLPLVVTNATAVTVIIGAIYVAVCSMNGYLHIFLNSVIRTEVKTVLKKLPCF